MLINYRRTSKLLAEQQARDAEAHRLRIFGIQALNSTASSSVEMASQPKQNVPSIIPSQPYYPTHFMYVLFI
jgi:hypothetical protein